jgi:drug/metabolite transporter (DMT)-like permease
MWNFDRIPIYNFFEENGTILSLIAIFFAVASFMAQLETPFFNNSILFAGIVMIIFLIGLLILILTINIAKYAYRLLSSNENYVFLQGIAVVIFASFIYVIYGSILSYFSSKNPDSMTICFTLMLLGGIFLGIFFVNLHLSEKASSLKKWGLRIIYCILSVAAIVLSINYFSIISTIKPELWQFFWQMTSIMLLCGLFLIRNAE